MRRSSPSRLRTLHNTGSKPSDTVNLERHEGPLHEKTGREPVYLLQLYPSTLQYRLFGDELSAWGFRKYFGGRFAGASAETTIESRQSRIPSGVD